MIGADESFYFKPDAGPAARLARERDPVRAHGRAARGDRHRPCDRPHRGGDAACGSCRAAAHLGGAAVLRRRWQTPSVGFEAAAPGFFWLAGQGGYGIQTAPALARAAASLLVDGVLPDDLLRQGIVAEDLLPLRFRLRPTADAERPSA